MSKNAVKSQKEAMNAARKELLQSDNGEMSKKTVISVSKGKFRTITLNFQIFIKI
jgi:hypothetical protein